MHDQGRQGSSPSFSPWPFREDEEDLHWDTWAKLLKIPLFKGEGKISLRERFQKLNTCFTLNPILMEDSIQLVILHLDGVAFDWWYGVVHTQGHNIVWTFGDFSKRILNHFELKDDDVYFIDLVALRKRDSLEAYIEEFKWITIMMSNISDKSMAFFFIEGLWVITVWKGRDSILLSLEWWFILHIYISLLRILSFLLHDPLFITPPWAWPFTFLLVHFL